MIRKTVADYISAVGLESGAEKEQMASSEIKVYQHLSWDAKVSLVPKGANLAVAEMRRLFVFFPDNLESK